MVRELILDTVRDLERDWSRDASCIVMLLRSALLLTFCGVATGILPARVAAARAAASWPLDRGSHPPMIYEPLAHLPGCRKALQQSLRTEAALELSGDIDGVIEALGGSDHAKVAIALLLLGGGGVDECHALVTPLSWPEATHFGGSAVYDSPAAQEATYAHSLVHRREAYHVGELGTGWRNSAFWMGSTRVHKDLASLMLQRARTAATDAESSACCDEALNDGWRPSELNKLCAAALQGEVS